MIEVQAVFSEKGSRQDANREKIISELDEFYGLVKMYPERAYRLTIAGRRGKLTGIKLERNKEL